MFSVVSVCPLGREGSHVTITHDALDLTIQGHFLYRDPPSPGPATPRHVQNLFLMKHVCFVSGRLVSYWNAFMSFKLKNKRNLAE